MIGIYRITSPSNKVYIGQSWNIERRFKQYYALHSFLQRKLHYSLLKHGVTEHKFEIIHELPIDVEQEILDNYEILYMEFYTDCGIELMNLRGGGIGGKMTEEHKERISKSLQGQKHPIERCIKNGLNKKGKYVEKLSKKVVNLDTGEVYPTIRLAGLSIGVKHSTLRSYLNGNLRNKTNMRYA